MEALASIAKSELEIGGGAQQLNSPKLPTAIRKLKVFQKHSEFITVPSPILNIVAKRSKTGNNRRH